MMTRQEFIAEAKRRGKSKEETRAKYDELDASGAFDDSPAPAPTPSPAAEPTAYEKYGIPGMLFPHTTESTEKGGNFGERMFAGMGDATTLPQRAVAGLATLVGYGFGAKGLELAAQEFSRFKPTEDTKGLTKFGQEVAYDPTLVPGLMTGATEAKLISKVPGLAKAAIPAASGAAQAGTSTAIRQSTEGEFDAGETAKNAGIGAVIPAAATGAAGATKKVFGETGKRLIQALIRPGRRGRKEGFDVNYIMNDKELLGAAGGGIENLQKALQGRFNKLVTDVKSIQETQGMDVNVDVPSVYLRVYKKLTESNDFTGMKPELTEALDGLKNNLNNDLEQFDEYTDLATAMKLRTNYGTKVNFQPAVSGGGRKAAFNASAEEKVYDAFYKELSAEIKEEAPKEIAAIDKEFTKLIPALKATNRRVLVETSNLPVGLMETVGGVGVGAATGMTGEGSFGDRVKRGLAGAAGGALITKGIKSPRTGGLLYKAGKSIGTPPAVLTTSPLNALQNDEDEESPYSGLKKKIQQRGTYR